jgi:DNA-binding transcriptional LysR family regulator
MRFDLVDLRLVLNIAEAASITAGASRSGLALASASERLRELERSLGIKLFERQRRGVSPTPAGVALVHHARLVTNQLEAMSGELGQFAKGLRGRVRVMSNTAATLEFLPPLIGAFLSRHPTIDVEIEDRPSPATVRAVAGGQADIGIVADVVDAAAELETMPFAEDRLVLVLPKRHALARRRRLAFHDVLDEDFVGLPMGNALQVYVDGQAAREGRRLKTRIRLSGFDATCKVVESGIGIAVVSKIAAARCARSMAIATVPLSDPWALRRLRICAKSFRALPAPARALVEALRPGSA